MKLLNFLKIPKLWSTIKMWTIKLCFDGLQYQVINYNWLGPYPHIR